MITRGGMSEIIYYKKIRELGLSEELFCSLPYECQRAIMMAGTDSIRETQEKSELKKRIALTQYDFEEKVKEKILSLFKKYK